MNQPSCVKPSITTLLILMAGSFLGVLVGDETFQIVEPKFVTELSVKGEKGDVDAQIALGKVYYEGKRHFKSYSNALYWYKKAANSGNPIGQLWVGKLYAEGKGRITRDLEEAINWYRKSAQQGNAQACYNLGENFYYYKGDLQEGIKWYRLGAENGGVECCWRLGVFYALGDDFGVEEDQVESFKWYKKAADQGDQDAIVEVGSRYMRGRGVEKNPTEGISWLKIGAEKFEDPSAQSGLGFAYATGEGNLQKDLAEAYRWWRKSADQGYSGAQYPLGWALMTGDAYIKQDKSEGLKMLKSSASQGHTVVQLQLATIYREGELVEKDLVESFKWLLMAANEGKKDGMYGVGSAYYSGNGVKKDLEKAFKWLVQGAALGSGHSQGLLGFMYWTGKGAVKNDVKAYQWSLLASAKGIQPSIDSIPLIEERLTPSQREEGQRLAQAFKPINETIKKPKRTFEPRELAKIEPKSTGTGFAISDDGYIITNEHVAGKGATVRIRTANGVLSAKVVRVDKANDIALLKAQGVFAPLPVISSRRIRLGSTVATVGFPNTDLQGFAPKLAKGEIASLAGAQDDARHFQISVPIQPGNSGGALVDARGNVVGVVVAKLSQKTAVAVTGTLAENVNYAVKSSYLLSFLESVPEVAAKLKDPNLKDLKFVDMVEGVQQATVLVLVY